MAAPTIVLLYNTTSNEGANTGGASGGVGANNSNWEIFDFAADRLSFLDDAQLDGDALTAPRYYETAPSSGSSVADKCFILKASTEVLVEVPLAGIDAQYAFCVHFTDATTSIPYLTVFDTSAGVSSISPFLGAGDSTQSSFRAVSTNTSSPGSDAWLGTPLAGEESILELSDVALTGAISMYFNLKQILYPAIGGKSSSVISFKIGATYA